MTAIYVSNPVHPDVLDELRALGTVHLGFGPARVDYASVAGEIEAIMLRSETFDRVKIAASPKLKIIARHGVGWDNVDIEAADEQGVWVTITPGRNSRAVAEHVFALTLALLRKIPVSVRRTCAGVWSERKEELTGLQLHQRTLGLLGLGSIGSMVTRIAGGFGMRVIVSDPGIDAETIVAHGAIKVPFDRLLAESDVLSLHAPLNAATRNIVDASAIARMRPGAILVNTSRGGLVDEDAMVDALRTGHLGGAALDVLAAESVDMKEPLAHTTLPIADLDTLIVTPHTAGQTDESLREVGQAALACIRQVLAGEEPSDTVNQPRFHLTPNPADAPQNTTGEAG